MNWKPEKLKISLTINAFIMKQIFFILIVVLLAGCFGSTAEKTGKEGWPIPEFSVLLLDSTTWLNTHNFAKGKPLALFYFSPNCPHCQAQTKEIIEEMDNLKDIQFYFISHFAINKLKPYIKTYELSKYPNIVTALDTSNILSNYFGAPGVPYLAIYNKDKKLNKSFLGEISGNQIKQVAEE
jgi:thioredoxin-related protein